MTATRETAAARSSVLKRGGFAVAAGVLAAGLGFGAAPAFAADGAANVTGASLSWQLNDESGGGAYFGGCNFLSAGAAGNSGSSRLWTESDGFYKSSDGDVTITKPDSAGTQVAPTWSTKCQNAAGGAVSPAAGSTTANRVNLANGTGTVDVDADTGSIAWDGSFTIVFYGGLTYWTVSDLHLDVENGEGTLRGTASGYGADMYDTSKWVELAPATIDLATFSGVDLAPAGVTINPDYAGVEVSVSGTPQVKTGATFGSFPQSFVTFNELTGQSSYWYSSGGAADPKKPAKPISVGYTIEDPETPVAGGAGDIDVTLPEVTPPIEEPSGEFGWAWASNDVVDLGTAAQVGDTFVANGSLNNVLVTDTRKGGASPYTWSLSGASSDFTSSTGSFSGSYLGWTPSVVDTASTTVTAGAAVASSATGGAGLATSSVLATSTTASSATLGAGLELVVPTTTASGDYRATLTVTAIS
ncbi:hypothetical protein HNR16_002066 [Pseudoclavibacter chungangensis]|uniref:HtaA domain-containing protein n=1 Tax=Pseudoclavibacter chungangensis TaxID=587635 RepID=UPI0015CD982C|nr:HtaA domain-containing protein [Pseudoclavibacter chungangensis]NYJ67278.1 hypothetical protein [Pseudoclavibacter chungangensis]